VASRLLRPVSVKNLGLVLFAVAACGGGSGGPGATDSCPDFNSGTCSDGDSCTHPSDGGRPLICDCQSGFWVCNSCPSVFSPPTGACEPGDACEWNSWEHGCSCGCGTDGQWSCAPLTIGTFECGGQDAGVGP